MRKAALNEKLEKEKEKLNKLANEALSKGIHLTQDEEFMAQNQKVDVLVVNIQKMQWQNKTVWKVPKQRL